MAPTLMAYRWDGFYSNEPGSNAWTEAQILSAPEWQGFAPPHAINVGPNKLKFDVTQARMDAEISYANALGSRFAWAFLMSSTGLTDTPVEVGMRAALDLYLSSTAKGTLKWCAVHAPRYLGAPGNFATEATTIAGLLARSDYLRVLTNRPVWQIFVTTGFAGGSVGGSYGTNSAQLAAMVASVRTQAQALGTGNPYVVLMGVFGGTTAEACRVAIGADAVTLYATGTDRRYNRPYSELTARAQTLWTDNLTAAAQVPLLMSGWNREARANRAPWYEPQYLPKMGSTGWYQSCTDAQFAQHITDGRAFMTANPVDCAAELMGVYSWFEGTEGVKTLCPTRADIAAGTWPARAAAIAAALA